MTTLADRLAALANPAPRDIDPEQSDLPGPRVASSDASAPDDAFIPATERLARNRTSLRAQRDTAALGKAYKGKVVSRAELFGDGGGDGGQEEEDDDDDEEEDDTFSGISPMDDEQEEEEEEDEEEGELAAAALRMVGQQKQKQQPQKRGRAAMEEEDDEEEEQEEDEGDEGESDEEEEQTMLASLLADSGIAEAEQEEVQRELAALADEERQQQILQRRSVTEEAEKARHVKAQRSIWESLLHMRIRLQQSMLHAHRLPQPGAFELFTGQLPSSSSSSSSSVPPRSSKKKQKQQQPPSSSSSSSSSSSQQQYSAEVRAKYRAAQESVRGLMSDLSALTAALAGNNPSMLPQELLELNLDFSGLALEEEEGEKEKEKEEERKAEERRRKEGRKKGEQGGAVAAAGEYASAVLEVQRPWYEEVIEKWNRRTQQASGSSVLASKQFKAINQSVVTQIRNILADEETLIKRSQLKRSNFSVIGKPASSSSSPADDQSSSATAPGAAGAAETYEEEHYDDTDFYQGLLREIIAMEGGGGGGASGADGDLLRTAKLARKRTQKAVDRRASKGRKVRYTVIPKLVSFMAPRPSNDEESVTDSLFASLFGKTPAAGSEEES